VVYTRIRAILDKGNPFMTNARCPIILDDCGDLHRPDVNWLLAKIHLKRIYDGVRGSSDGLRH
jgi:hypothetical protein